MLSDRCSQRPKSANLASEIVLDPVKRSKLLKRLLRTHPADPPAHNPNITGIKIISGGGRASEPVPIPSRSPLDPYDSLQAMLPENLFLGMLCLERKRSERSRRNFLLVLLHTENMDHSQHKVPILKDMIRAADASRRETDLAGWYVCNKVLGIIFTELGALDETATAKKLLQKVYDYLDAELNPDDRRHVHVSSHIFPDELNGRGSDCSVNPAFYPDLLHLHSSKKASQTMKRAMDVVCSAAALVLCSPLLVLIAAATKLSSRGPILFEQERLGRFGTKFKCLKIRSMNVDNDPRIQKEFMKRVIEGSHDGNSSIGDKPSYKMTNDPRVTRIGRFLRRTSLDELPQFINVLMGDMSLVGPRPALAYEYEEYDVWHRRRVLEVKPGITGLWQVNGRSRVQFNEMVRLDLQYARGWSLWLDFKILLQTPLAVVSGDGAF
jgi:lipopolysaccharide/colanic/teichoic acid biosynthesis glycosyltransferase